VSVPSYAGPIRVRGRALDASARVLRFAVNGPTTNDRLDLQARPAASPTSWSFWPTSMWVPGPGCYGVQIDTLAGTDIVIFEATAH
jgi:hypothetical protein